MDIRQLRYFIAIVEERTVSAAAKRLHLSQPPLSQQLKAMEEELGTPLVERNGKTLGITEAGHRLYEYALQMVELMEAAKTEVQEVGSGMNGKLAIGVNTLSVEELPELLRRFRLRYPKISYKIQQSESSHLCQLVRSRAVELAFIRLPLDLGDDLAVLHFDQEPFYLISSGDLPIDLDREVSLAELSELPLLLPSTQGLGVHYLILNAFAELQLEPNLLGECSDIALLMNLVSSGFGVSIVPETLLKQHPGYPIVSHKIADEAGMTSSVGLVALRNRRLSKAALHFIELLQSSGDKG
ncbi:LysR family transcriptional regulator [Cohnella thailandensis]|uniref:LysR family transcriptional regulator n=1 Tax=Cohnella thailandensis TaxID=557557 RepID=A0A841T9C1_9BACL|nr:LysR family transcriptional regulator [Cohnella thailandensis]MBB6638447.1 LysR family transcriptional regulator [Cohnella thailandensis]MBP1977075.1 DNA-binding transcriptional LysR family regulator [Cohnella thailandensis]